MTRSPLLRPLMAVGMAVLVTTSSVLLASCTSGTTLGSSGTVTLSTPPGTGRQATTAATTRSSITPTPVTPDGLLTGPGVDDTTITLGLLVDRADDRGFSTGVALWERVVNNSGGICGRTIVVTSNHQGESLTASYARVAAESLGLITMPSASDTTSLADLSTADQVPTLTLSGSSAALTKSGPVVIGATEDIKAINALAYLRSTGRLPKGSVLSVVADNTAAAADALSGARWWAGLNGVTIDAGTAATPIETDTQAAAVLVIAGPAVVKATLAATTRKVDVITNLDGYDPAVVPDPDKRLLVTMATPAFGSDNPGAAAVARAFVASGQTEPGPDLMSGYGVAAAWGRLLTRACTDLSLTREGLRAAMTTVGPASVDSLFGPSDPGLVVGSALPATRVSSIALADAKALGGLRPLIWFQAAPDIADYVPGR